ncbi:hypothetical protein DFH09DRAFT_1118978 [Mycena vulgaris]|nr:hypothetical protein DFH09DRAFT_1118978 [Mycena vulgaris]
MIAAKSQGHGSYCARSIRSWIHAFLTSKKLPLHRYGQYHSSILDDGDFADSSSFTCISTTIPYCLGLKHESKSFRPQDLAVGKDYISGLHKGAGDPRSLWGELLARQIFISGKIERVINSRTSQIGTVYQNRRLLVKILCDTLQNTSMGFELPVTNVQDMQLRILSPDAGAGSIHPSMHLTSISVWEDFHSVAELRSWSLGLLQKWR